MMGFFLSVVNRTEPDLRYEPDERSGLSRDAFVTTIKLTSSGTDSNQWLSQKPDELPTALSALFANVTKFINLQHKF
jgi:hypothetical protein